MTEVAKAKKEGTVTTTDNPFEASNFLRQFRDKDSRELQQLSAAQFMKVWEHYDEDGKNNNNLITKKIKYWHNPIIHNNALYSSSGHVTFYALFHRKNFCSMMHIVNNGG